MEYRWLSASLRLARAHGRGATRAEALADAFGPAYGDAPGGEEGGERPGERASDPSVPRDAPLFAGRVEVAVARSDAPLDRAGRRRAVLERLRAQPDTAMTVKAHAERHGVSAATASNDLRELERRGELEASGNKRSLRFTLRRRASDRATDGSAKRPVDGR